MAGKAKKLKYCVYISFQVEVGEEEDPWVKAELELPSGWEIEDIRVVE